jgi:ribosome biogenesis ATPase
MVGAGSGGAAAAARRASTNRRQKQPCVGSHPTGMPTDPPTGLIKYMKEAFSQQGTRGFNIDAVVDHIRSKAPEYQNQPAAEVRVQVTQMMREMTEHQRRGKQQTAKPALGQPPLTGVPAARDVSVVDSDAQVAGSTINRQAARVSKKRRRGAGEGKSPSRQRRTEKNSTQGDSDAPDDGTTSAEFRPAERPAARLADMGGVEPCLQTIRELIQWPLAHPEVYKHLGVDPPIGVLLHGPPGCGKTTLAHAIAGELGVAFFKLSAPELVNARTGASEGNIRKLFDEAKAHAPAIIFIDEVDAITPKRENAQSGMERRIVAQLLASMNDLTPKSTGVTSGEASGGNDDSESAPPEVTRNTNVIVIGATNRPDAIDAALRRAGRFDREISLGIPDEGARMKILQTLSKKLVIAEDVSWARLARSTPGFVGADLKALTREAATVAIKRILGDLGSAPILEQPADSATTAVDANAASNANQDQRALENAKLGSGTTLELSTDCKGDRTLSPEQLAPLAVNQADFEAALSSVQPSSQREGFATIPDVSFDDIGALHEVRRELEMTIVQPVQQPERFAAFGIAPAAGVLLYGPPGCGKTLVAKAIAHHAKVNFISIKGPELLNKYVGESERAVRQVFSRGRASAPCVIFFDELDALCPRRSKEATSSSERVVNQLLTELDGLEPRRHVFIIAATNRPDMIDPAMLRPGRLDKLLYVPLPLAAERAEILRALTSKMPLAADVSLAAVAADPRAEGYSGADLAGLAKEAAVLALKEAMTQTTEIVAASVDARHFDLALAKISPSVSPRDRKAYARQRIKLGRSRGHLTGEAEGDGVAADDVSQRAEKGEEESGGGGGGGGGGRGGAEEEGQRA